MTKKKKIGSMLAGMLALALVVGTWAYYTSTTSVQNKLQTISGYGTETEEKFTPEGEWEPGQKVDKEVLVKNTGDASLFVRVKMDEAWSREVSGVSTNFITHASSNAKFLTATAATATQISPTDGETAGDDSVVFKELDLGTTWTFNPADGYWYYNSALDEGDDTGNLLKSITLSGNADMGLTTNTNYYTKASTKPAYTDIGTDPDTQWVVYSGTVPTGTTYTRAVDGIDSTKAGYAGADYVLTITTETLQASKEAFDATSGWSTMPASVKTALGLD